jgi:nitric oxide reductase large subunit
MTSQASLGVTLVRIASVYLVGVLLLGFVMATSKDYSLTPVHSHLGLLGWATMAVTGLAYVALPRLAASKLAAVHFWLHNIGLPVMMGALALAVLRADPGVEPAIGLGSVLVIAGLLAFTINVFANGKAEPAAGR